MTKYTLKKIIRECLNESIAPGLAGLAMPLEDSPDTGKIGKNITEDIADLGAKMREVPDDELSDRMKNVYDRKKSDGDKFKYPYIHRSNIEMIDIVDDNGTTVKKANVEAFKKLISKRPEYLVSQNSKMVKTSGETEMVYNTTLPAFNGLIVNEMTNKFFVVNTCPSAGGCRVFCYAKHGGYVQWKATSLRQTRILNFLFNDWQEYKNMLLSELRAIIQKDVKKGKKVTLRWNDSGDMLSDKYLEIVLDVAKATPEINHYAYTKQVDKAKEIQKVNKNFIFNFSKGALPHQDKLIDASTDKLSVVVPDVLLKGAIIKDKVKNKWIYSDETSAKQKIASKYSLDIKKLLTIDELTDMPVGKEKEYNVIVLPGESDLPASRRDVHGTYLILH